MWKKKNGDGFFFLSVFEGLVVFEPKDEVLLFRFTCYVLRITRYVLRITCYGFSSLLLWVLRGDLIV